MSERAKWASFLGLIVVLGAVPSDLLAAQVGASPPAGPAAPAAPTPPATGSQPATASQPIVRVVYPPANWLPAEGKSDAWTARTEKCRQLLDKLKLDDPLAVKYLPNVKDKISLLNRTPAFDWKKACGVEFLENMLADLADGKVPNRRYAGGGVGVPYWSDLLGRMEVIWLHVPAGYDPQKQHQIFMCYKCGGGIYYKDGKATGGYRPTTEMANKFDTFFAWSSLYYGVKGRMCVDYELMEAVPALTREFSIDPDRVFLTGWSDGGFTDLWLAAAHPHLVAGIAPNCANWQYSNVNQVGLLNVALLVVDGWSDGGYVERNFTRMMTLGTMGGDVAAIFGKHGHSYQPYEDEEELRQILDWAKTKKRDLWPKRVRYGTWNLCWHRAYWLSIERMANPSLGCQIDAQVADNAIEVRAANVGAYKLALSDKLVDPARPVKVVTNGKESYSGPFKEELAIELVKLPETRFVKDAAMPGGITAQIADSYYGLNRDGGFIIPSRRWLSVKPTGCDEKTADLLKKWWAENAKADSELTEGDLAGNHLIVYGGPEINKFSARIAEQLPVKFDKGKFTVGAKVYDRPTECVKFIHPNPLSPKRYVIVYGFNDAAAFAARDCFGMRGESAWGFRSGDCVVMGVPAEKRKWGVGNEGGAFENHHVIFDSTYRPGAEPPLGELTTRFDDKQILRLRADAIRQAAPADVGVIWSHTPGWMNWRRSLPAGAVTLGDLAGIDSFPEYVTLGEITGEALAKMLPRAAASTVLPDRRDPAFDEKSSLVLGELEAKKTYIVAMGYQGIPAYGVSYEKMPRTFFFKGPEEFLAGGLTSLPVRNLRQVPLEVNQAVAGYIQKNKRVSPRPACFDLVEYLTDPRTNEFGALDWLHLGADAAFARKAGGPLEYRYTLNIGLRGADEPDLAPPRKNSKKFLDLGPAAGAAGGDFDYATLDRKLPVTATVSARELGVADQDGKARLVAAGAAGAVGSAVLLDIRLSNKGDKDAVGLAAMCPMNMQRVSLALWPAPPEKGQAPPYYVGYHHAVGQGKEPPTYEDAALLLFDAAAPKVDRLIAPSVGFDSGFVGFRIPLAVKAGKAVALPLLLIAVDRPKGADLPAVLEAIRGDLVKTASAPAGPTGP